MKRSLYSRLRCVGRSVGVRSAAAGIALGALVVATPTTAEAQEIQLTGPLAGAPSTRKMRLYREGRVELAVGPGFTLLNEYQHTGFLSGRLQYNIFDWLGISVFGGYGLLSLNTDLTDRIEETAPRNSRTAVNLPGNVPGQTRPKYDSQTGKLKWMFAPQLTFSPFRGKLALFQKLFTDTDLYILGGAAFVGVEERGDCGGAGKVPCTDTNSFAPQSRMAVAPTFGAGFTFYLSNMVSLNLEYRAFPFSWNRGGFDTRGAPPDASFPDTKVDQEDRTFKFNQMIFIAAGFHLPTKPKVSD